MTKKAVFQLKEDETTEVEISEAEVAEIVPDADFRFSLVNLLNGEHHFVKGTESEVWEKLRQQSDIDLDLNIIL